MRGVVLNENQILKNALENGDLGDKLIVTLSILTRHYFSELKNSKLDKKELNQIVFDKICEFMSNNYSDYKQNKWNNTIKKTIELYKDNDKKWNLVDVEYISITKNEWLKIRELNDDVLERLSFIMLVYQKINFIKNPNSDTWINQDINDIFKEAKITLRGEEKILRINKLYNKGYISQSMNCLGTSIKLEYTDANSENMIHIDNFNNVISYYYEFRDKVKYRECKECGIRFEVKKGMKTRCFCCDKKIKNMQSAQRMKKRYYKNSM